MIPARPRRVDELAAPVCGPRVHEDHDARRRAATSEQCVHGLGKRGTKGRAVVPHGFRARVALDDVDGRIAPLGILVVAWRHIDLDRALGGIAQRVVRQQLADDDMPIETALEGSLIGIGKRRPVDHGLGHARDATAPARTRVRAPRHPPPDGEPLHARDRRQERRRNQNAAASERHVVANQHPTSRRAPLI